MPAPFDYSSALGGSAGVSDAVNGALFNSQKLQSNQSELDQQARVDAARAAAAQIAGNPHIDDAQFETLLQPIAQADPATASAMRSHREMQSHLKLVIAHPTPKNIAEFGIAYPQELAPIQKAYDGLDKAAQDETLRTAHDIYSLWTGGKTDAAKSILDQRIQADKVAGLDVAGLTQMRELMDSNPDAVPVLAGSLVSTAVGHDKFPEMVKNWGENRRADELQPAAVREAEATAASKETEAQFAPAKAASDLASAEATRQRQAAQTASEIVANRIAQGRLALDQDKLTTETQLKLQELGANAVKLDPDSTKLMNEAAGESVESQQSAATLRDMAGKFKALGQAGVPAFTNTSEWFKRVTGNQGAYTQIRNEYTRLINTEALKGRKNMPGAMSDADRNFLLQGFPKQNASGAYISHWLETMAHAQEVNARLADRKSSWISANGNLGTSKTDLDVGGVKVPKGTSFGQFVAQVGAANTSLPSGISALADKYGH